MVKPEELKLSLFRGDSLGADMDRPLGSGGKILSFGVCGVVCSDGSFNGLAEMIPLAGTTGNVNGTEAPEGRIG